MKITIITLFPDMLFPFLNESIIKRAQEKNVVKIEIIQLRDFAKDTHGTVDDRPYGGGAGMVLRVDVLSEAISAVNTKGSKTILTSAKGNPYNQAKAQELSKLDHIIIIAGHYEGVDERIMSHIDEEISIGDFILTGGEIPAAVIVDSLVRLLPGVLKKSEATTEESFFTVPLRELKTIVGETETLKSITSLDVRLLEYPQYTRPEEHEGKGIPEILLSGNHEEIRKWRIKKAYEETKTKRPDLLAMSGME
ncbi:MAG: tRNA (guanosine(37)-N1)-methyltransferase TrmD [bacterium]|nr:tRNA (guanosine(37)-N1)-methyltransferase TrmD [bacterium]